MTFLLVGVIGPRGHGKTALVRALSGLAAGAEARDADIEAATPLRLGRGAIDLLDLPGREGSAEAVILAVAGLGAVLLAVDAQAGLTPQALEQIEVARSAGLRRGVVALTRVDLAAPGMLASRTAEVAAAAARAGLDHPAVVATSARTGQGLGALRSALAALLDANPPPADDGFPYLPVDAAVAQPGLGTMVAGTLRRGRLAVGDSLGLAPGGTAATVRGLQIHGQPVDRAEPGQRIAAVLQGLEPAEIRPGQAMCAPGLLAGSAWIDVTVSALAGADAPLASGTACRLLCGSADVPVQLRLLDRDGLEPGASAQAQLDAGTEIAIPAREPFLLRSDAPARIVAAGQVLDPASRRHERHDPQVLSDLAVLARGERGAILDTRLGRAGAAGAPLPELARLAGVAPERARRALDALGAREIGDRFLGAAAFDALCQSLLATLRRHHREQPMEQGLPVERILRTLGLDETVALAALHELIATGAVARTGALYRRAEFDPVRDETELMRRLEAQFRRAGLSPPDEAEVVGRDPRRREALTQLIGAGTVIRAVDRVQRRAVLFHRDAILDARARLARAFPGATTPETGFLAREAGAVLGISRKFSIPLLEHLDAAGFTRRAGDRRTIIGTR